MPGTCDFEKEERGRRGKRRGGREKKEDRKWTTDAVERMARGAYGPLVDFEWRRNEGLKPVTFLNINTKQ